MSDICMKCEGSCCSFETMEISYVIFRTAPDKPFDEWTHEDFIFALEKNIDNPVELLDSDEELIDMEWYIQGGKFLKFKCNHQLNSGKCGIYDKRPNFCRAFQCFALDQNDERDLDDMKDEGYFDPDNSNMVEVTEIVNNFLEEKIDKFKNKTTTLVKRG